MMPYPCINMNPIFSKDIGQQSIPDKKKETHHLELFNSQENRKW